MSRISLLTVKDAIERGNATRDPELKNWLSTLDPNLAFDDNEELTEAWCLYTHYQATKKLPVDRDKKAKYLESLGYKIFGDPCDD